MAQGEIGEARATLSLVNDQFMKALHASGKAFVRTATRMAKIGRLTAAAGAAITEPALAAAKAFASCGDQLDKMGGQAKAGVKTLQELGFAAKKSSESMGTMEKAAKKMQGSTAAAKGVNDQFMKALHASGRAFVRTAAGMARIGGLGAAAGAAIAGPALAAAKAFASYGDQLDKMSGRTGVGVETLQELGFAAEQSGASLENVEKAVKKMQESTVNAAKGGQELRSLFQGLGISLDDFQQLAAGDRFKLLADRIGKIEDPATRTSAAMKLLGEDGIKLMNLFASGSEGIEEYARQARELGLVFSETDTKSAAAMTDAMNEAGRAVKATWLAIGGAVAPVVTEILGKVAPVVATMTQWIRENKQLVATVFKIAVAVAGIGTALVAAGGALAAVATVAGTVVAAIGTVVGTVVSLATSFAAIPILIGAIAAVAAYQFGLVDKAIGSIREAWMKAWGGIVASVMKGDLQTAIDITWTAVQITFYKGLGAVKSGWRGTIDFIRNVWDSASTMLAKGILTLISTFKLMGKTVAIVFKTVLDNAKVIGNALMHPVQTARKLAAGQDLGLKTNIVGDLKAATGEVAKELKGTLDILDEDHKRRQSARAAASRAAYDADRSRIADLQAKQNALIAKANEPLATEKQAEELAKQTKAFQALRELAAVTGAGSISTRAIRAGQSLGDKTVKEIKKGIDKLGGLTAETNQLLENMAMPGG